MFLIFVVDFGASNFYLPNKELQTSCGSPEYCAPELIAPVRMYGPKIDVWSL